MLWLDEWKAWSARLAAAREAMQIIVSQRLGPTEQQWTESRAVTGELLELYELLVQFSKTFSTQLPPSAAAALEAFFLRDGPIFAERGMPSGTNVTPARVLVLSKVRAQVDYFISDKQARGRRAVERAFTHLQRSIVADEDVRMKWQRAFAVTSGRIEEAAEKLGAVHLLLHGIWAFKADAAGGKTDLILGEAVNDEDVLRAAEAMVLTEWKVVREGENPSETVRQAFHQAELYTSGALAGFELSSHRYLVLVSRDWLTPRPTAPSASGRIYEVRNIAVNPSSPSVAARLAAGRGPKIK